MTPKSAGTEQHPFIKWTSLGRLVDLRGCSPWQIQGYMRMGLFVALGQHFVKTPTRDTHISCGTIINHGVWYMVRCATFSDGWGFLGGSTMHRWLGIPCGLYHSAMVGDSLRARPFSALFIFLLNLSHGVSIWVHGLMGFQENLFMVIWTKCLWHRHSNRIY